MQGSLLTALGTSIMMTAANRLLTYIKTNVSCWLERKMSWIEIMLIIAQCSFAKKNRRQRNKLEGWLRLKSVNVLKSIEPNVR